MNAKFYLLRHGHTENQSDGLAFASEIPLSDKGKEQIANTAESIKQLGITDVLSSPYLRTKQSLDIVMNTLNEHGQSPNIQFDERLREIGGGILEKDGNWAGGIPHDLHTCTDKYGSESYEDLHARVMSVMHDLKNLENEGKLGERILISGHGMMNNMFRYILLNGTAPFNQEEFLRQKKEKPLSHASLVEVDMNTPKEQRQGRLLCGDPNYKKNVSEIETK